jgi:hypothetical protein
LERILRSLSRVNRSKLLTHHAIQQDAHAFDETEENAADDCAADHVSRPVPCCHDGAGSRPAHDRVERVFFLPEVGEGAVKGCEAKTPGCKLAPLA